MALPSTSFAFSPDAPVLARLPGRPLYQNIVLLLRHQLAAGTLAPGVVFPPEDALARQCGVARLTMRQALAVLVAEGWLVRRQGFGTVVAPPAPRRPAPARAQDPTAEWEALRVTLRDLQREMRALRKLLQGRPATRRRGPRKAPRPRPRADRPSAAAVRAQTGRVPPRPAVVEGERGGAGESVP